MRTINRISWLLLGIGVTSLGVGAALAAGASVLLHLSVPFFTVWAASAVVIGFKVVFDTGSPPPLPPSPTSPPSSPRSEPEIRLDDLHTIRDCWQRGDIGEEVYRRAVAQATRRFTPPPPPARPRRRWWQ